MFKTHNAYTNKDCDIYEDDIAGGFLYSPRDEDKSYYFDTLEAAMNFVDNADFVCGIPTITIGETEEVAAYKVTKNLNPDPAFGEVRGWNTHIKAELIGGEILHRFVD